MPRDHFVAQTYLKHFLDPELGNLLHAYDKKELCHFTPPTQKICCAQDWDTNPYFENERAISQYLNVVEPRWNDGIGDIKNLLRYQEVKYFMAGYIAVLSLCTPAAIRTMTHNTSEMLASGANMIAQQMQKNPERFPGIEPLPDDLFQDLMESGGLVATVDSKHTHAMAAQALIDVQWTLYKSPWIILCNETDNKFLTSDYPACYYYPESNSRPACRYIPISPNFAILIWPEIDEKDREHPKEPLERFPNTEVKMKNVRHPFTKLLNKLTIKSAERFVISASREAWIMPMVEKYKDWKMDSGTVQIPHDNGALVISRMMARKSPLAP